MTTARLRLLCALTVVLALLVGIGACTTSGEVPGDSSPEPDGTASLPEGGADATPDATPDATLLPDATNDDGGPGADGAPDATLLPDAPDATTEDTGPTLDAPSLLDGPPSDAGDAATTSSATIGPTGGTLVHPLGAMLQIPAGAIATPTLLTLTPIAAPTSGTVIGGAFRLDPPGLALAVPAVLTLAYLPADVPDGAATSSLAIELSTDTGATFTALASTPDTVSKTIAAQTVQSGEFAPIITASGLLFITTPSPLVGGTVGVAYSTSFAATGGTAPYSWSVSPGAAPPPGTTIGPTGVLSGTPTAAGQYSFFVRVADSNAHVTQATFSMAVNGGAGTDGGGVTGPDNPTPTLTSLSPTSTPEQTSADLTLTGTGFVPATTAYVGASVTTIYVSATQVIARLSTANLPAPGSYTITVVNPAPGGGTSNGLTLTAVPLNPVPSIVTLVPLLAPAGSPDTQVTIIGTSFVPASTVLVNGSVIASSYVSASQIVALIPAADLASVATLSVAVQSPAPGGGASNTAMFAVGGNADGTPIITSVTPTGTPTGTPITITLNGSGFAYQPLMEVDPLNHVPWKEGYVLFDGMAIATTYVSSTQVNGTVIKALVQNVHTASVSYANTMDAGVQSLTLGSIGNAVPFDVTDAGGWDCVCVPAGQVCRNNACCIDQGVTGQGSPPCCSGLSKFNVCTSVCNNVGWYSGQACDCCTGSNGCNGTVTYCF